MTKIKAGNIYMCLKDISGYDSFTKGKVYSSIYDNALINDNHIEVKVMNSECFRIATDKEVFKAKLDWLKEETSIGLSEHDNGVETGRMEVINALYRLLDSMQEEPVHVDLEEEIEQYMDHNYYIDEDFVVCDRNHVDFKFHEDNFKEVARHFAEWQKQQMLKDAKLAAVKDATVAEYWDNWLILDPYLRGSLKDGEKVKIVILKE